MENTFPFFDAGGSESWYPPPSHHSQHFTPPLFIKTKPQGGGYFAHPQKIIKKNFSTLLTIILFHSLHNHLIIFFYPCLKLIIKLKI